MPSQKFFGRLKGRVDADGEVFCEHGLAAKLLKTKKEGPNKDREFWTCPKGQSDAQQCKLFLWADEIDKHKPGGASSSPSHSSPTPSSPLKRKAPVIEDDEDITEDEDYPSFPSSQSTPSKKQATPASKKEARSNRIEDSDDEWGHAIMSDDDDAPAPAPPPTQFRPPLPPIRRPQPVVEDPIIDVQEKNSTPRKGQPPFSGFSTPQTTPIKAMPVPMSTPSSSISTRTVASTPGPTIDDDFLATHASRLPAIFDAAMQPWLDTLKSEVEKKDRLIKAHKRSLEAKDSALKKANEDIRQLKAKIRVLEVNSV